MGAGSEAWAGRPGAVQARFAGAVVAAGIAVLSCVPMFGTANWLVAGPQLPVTRAYADAQVSDGSLSCGGVRMAALSGLQTLSFGDIAAIECASDASFAASIVPLGVGQRCPDDADPQEYYDALVDLWAQVDGVALTARETRDVAVDAKAYSYTLYIDNAGVLSVCRRTYVLGPNAAACVTAVYPVGDSNGESRVDRLLRSVIAVPVLASDDSADESTATPAGQSSQSILAAALAGQGAPQGGTSADKQGVKAGGLAFELPGDLVGDDDPHEPMWCDQRGSVVVGIIPSAVPDASGFADKDFDSVAGLLQKGLGGTGVGSVLVDTQSAQVHMYPMVIASSKGAGADGTQGAGGAASMIAQGDGASSLMGALCLVKVADGSLTIVLMLCGPDAGSQTGALLADVVRSIGLA